MMLLKRIPKIGCLEHIQLQKCVKYPTNLRKLIYSQIRIEEGTGLRNNSLNVFYINEKKNHICLTIDLKIALTFLFYIWGIKATKLCEYDRHNTPKISHGI